MIDDYDWSYDEHGVANPHIDELKGPMQGGPFYDLPRVNDSSNTVAVLMHDYPLGKPPTQLRVEDINWDSEDDRNFLIETYNEWLRIHLRVPIAVFSNKSQYNSWREQVLGNQELPDNWHTEMRVPFDNGPALFDCQVPHLGDVDSFEEGMERVNAFLELQKKEE